jgi:NADH dehydrogenase
MHHTIDKIPEEKNKERYSWQKDHLENQTGSKNSHKPIRIKKDEIQKKYETWK